MMGAIMAEENGTEPGLYAGYDEHGNTEILLVTAAGQYTVVAYLLKGFIEWDQEATDDPWFEPLSARKGQGFIRVDGLIMRALREHMVT